MATMTKGLRTDFPKLLYFASRNAAFDRAGFVARWRQHAQLDMFMPRWENVERYVHCDAQRPQPESGLPGVRSDGVMIIWYRSEERRLAHVADRTTGPAPKQDEGETFDRPVREVSVLTEEHRFLAPHTAAGPTGRCNLFLAVNRGVGEAAASLHD